MHAISLLNPFSRSRVSPVTVIAIGHCRALGMHATSLVVALSRSRAPTACFQTPGQISTLCTFASSSIFSGSNLEMRKNDSEALDRIWRDRTSVYSYDTLDS